MASPLSPEDADLARMRAYYGGLPPPTAPAPAPAPVPPPPAPAAPPVEPWRQFLPVGNEPPPVPLDASGFTPPSQPLTPPPAMPQQPPVPNGPPVTPPPPKPPPALGPTPQDDAELAALTAKLSKPKAAGGPAAKPNPDPYGIKGAQKGIVGSYDDQAGAQNRMGAADAYRAQLQADHHAELSRRMDEDAAIAGAEEALAAEQTQKSMDEVSRQLDDVRSRKIKPLDLMEQGTAMGILAVVAGAVGGFYQGLNGMKENPVLADLDRFAERQMAADEKNRDNEKAVLGQKLSLLGTQRQIHRDGQMAKLAARNLVYEAAKEQIAADGAEADVAWKKAAADAAIAEINRGQQTLLKTFGEQARAQAMAAAGQATAQRKEVMGVYREIYDKALTAGYTPAQAEYEAKRTIGILYAPGTVGERSAAMSSDSGLGKTGREKLALEHHEAQAAADEFNSQVDAMKKHPALDDLGITTGTTAKLGPRLAPESNRTMQDLNQLNTQIINAIGKVARDAEGKPNVLMMERYEHRFSIEPDDTKEQAIQKIEGARNVVNSLARQHGATEAPKPSARQDTNAELGAKPVR